MYIYFSIIRIYDDYLFLVFKKGFFVIFFINFNDKCFVFVSWYINEIIIKLV